MKKTYINPELEVIKIATVQMLAESGPKISTGSTPTDPDESDMPGFIEIGELDIFKNL